MARTGLQATVVRAAEVAFRRIAAAVLLTAAASASAQTPAPQALAEKHGCMSCHGLVHKQVGPGFAQVAARYRDDREAPTRLAGRIRGGSVGAWGRVIMPRQPQVTEADAQLLARWVLSQTTPR